MQNHLKVISKVKKKKRKKKVTLKVKKKKKKDTALLESTITPKDYLK